jgi:hypothetical protein
VRASHRSTASPLRSAECLLIGTKDVVLLCVLFSSKATAYTEHRNVLTRNILSYSGGANFECRFEDKLSLHDLFVVSPQQDGQNTYNVTRSVRVTTAISINYSKCGSVFLSYLSGVQKASFLRRFTLWSVWIHYAFPHCPIDGTIFGKKNLWNIKCVL